MAENVNIKLEVGRDPKTGKLGILARFDPNAPNFTKDENSFIWYPTAEERELLNEAINLISKK